MAPPALHPGLSSLEFLIGRWEGQGRGLWKADPPVRYREEIVFSHFGKPVLQYQQKTFDLDSGKPMHAEMGYLRVAGEGQVELLVVQPTGFAEIHTGTVANGHLQMRLLTLSRTPSALALSNVSRDIWLENNDLSYLLRLSMNDEPLADHLKATLQLQP